MANYREVTDIIGELNDELGTLATAMRLISEAWVSEASISEAWVSEAWVSEASISEASGGVRHRHRELFAGPSQHLET